jgi:alpha-tubulin suppressor-like RCC1 family protein
LGDGTTEDRLVPVGVSGLSSGAIAVAAGGDHSCALTAAGGVKCWGSNLAGQLGDGTTITRTTPVDVSGLDSDVAAVGVGYRHTCALTTAGGVKCWGLAHTTPVDVVALNIEVTAITAGFDRTCALTAAGEVKCWGSLESTPEKVGGFGSEVTAIAAGADHTCALLVTGGVQCWGRNTWGQVGDGTNAQRPAPVDVVGLSSGVTAIAAGGDHTCALMSTGGIKCWGYNWYGQLGDGSIAARQYTPVEVRGLGSGITAITTGAVHTCALTSAGGAMCWGSNHRGELGNGTTVYRALPVDVGGLGGVATAIATTEGHTCVVAAGGAMCWGSNQHSQLGDGTMTYRFVPEHVSGLEGGVTAVTAGRNHTCALSAEDGVTCWGSNLFGQLGDGTAMTRTTPVAVSGLDNGVTAIAAGWYHTCALMGVGAVKCWGSNGQGQLGDGTKVDRYVPVAAYGLESEVLAVAAGAYHTCALTSTGGVKCWGDSNLGQVGPGFHFSHPMPVDVSGLGSGMMAVTAGRNHTCALTSTGGVKCWGGNYSGQLGSTLPAYDAILDVVGLDAGAAAVAAGGHHTCALTTAGVTKCWGDNSLGQLGIGGRDGSTEPVNVHGLASGVTMISGGDFHTCALMAAGHVKCWGDNALGQLGVNPGWTPTVVIGFEGYKVLAPLVYR